MKSKILLFIVFITTFFVRCQNEKPSSSSTTTSTPSVEAVKNSFYKHFTGTIDSFAITMDLVRSQTTSNDFESYYYTGHYYYNKYQQPIGLYGEDDSSGNIILHESNWQDKEYVFTGKLDANGNFTGTWLDTLTKKSRTFTLKENNAGGVVQFESEMYKDSAKLWPGKAGSPTAYFDMHLLLPAKNTEGGIAAFLKDKIFMGVKNDTIEKSYANLSVESMRNAIRDTFFASYRETLKDEKPEDVGITMNYAESSSMEVIFNEGGILSLGYSAYTYGGGAHGNHATALASYDIVQKKTLTLNDVFLPKYEKTLDKALAGAVRRLFGLKANEPLSSRLFDNNLEHNTNFCITKKGILFIYNPYEIAAYAYGELELFVPFEEIKSVVNPRFLTM